MNIEDFVSQALRQIGAGVLAGHKQPGIVVSPRPYKRDDQSNMAGEHMIDSRGNRIVVMVEFELSVVVRSKIEGEVSAKLEVLGVDFGGGKIDTAIAHERVQRIKFHVPVSFPPPKDDA